MTRQKRSERRSGIAIRLTDRDRELVHALGRFRIARTRDLVALYFRGVRRDTAAVRLRRLFDAGFLDIRSRDPSVENLYLLGPRGRKLVVEEGGSAASIPRGSLDHHLAIVSTWVAVASEMVAGLEIELARADWEIRKDVGGVDVSVVPDLFLVLRGSVARLAIAVEIDRSTEPLHILRDKVARYVELRESGRGILGWREFGLGVGFADPQREELVRHAIESVWSGWCFSWSSELALRDAVREVADALQPPITPSPHGKGREAHATGCRASASLSGRGGH